MASLYVSDTSYWVNSAPDTGYPKLTDDLKVDVAIIGGGIAGLTAAYLLKQAGKKVALLEKDTIGSGVTGHTTGKVTSQHGLNYHRLQRYFGTQAAKLYGEANQTAIQEMEKVITAERIDCDWQRDDNYVFSEKPGEIKMLQQEAEVAAQLGLPATFVTQTGLPFEVQGAVKFTGQAKFHAVKYLHGLARAVDGGGSYVFEHTKGMLVNDGTPCTLRTSQGKVTAGDVIIATDVPAPIVMHTVYSVLEYPTRSYIVASETKDELRGMYISSSGPTRSILPVTSGGKHWLLIGGESHFPGLGYAGTRYGRLADYAKERFGITDIQHRWWAMDYLSYDELIPLIGKAYPWSKHVYVATGFKKWGLAHSMVAGMILRDSILGQPPNPWAATYTSMRLSPITSIPRFLAKSVGL